MNTTPVSFADAQRADRRLTLLRALAAASQYRANAFLLRRFADSVGHTVSADTIAADLAWLSEQALVTTTTAEGVLIAAITQQGLDVSEGRAGVPGVAKPQPGF